MAKNSEIAVTARLVGVSFREACRRAARGGYRLSMAWHSSIEVEVEPGLSMLLCRGCSVAPRMPWPCGHYERTERDLAEIEARWAREDEARVAS